MTAGQEAFCQAYARSWNATAAMLEAYPGRRSWKRDAVTSAASRLLSENSNVSARVEELRKENAELGKISREGILAFLARVINGEDIADYVTEGASGSKTAKGVSKSWAVEQYCRMCGYDRPEKVEEQRGVIRHEIEIIG